MKILCRSLILILSFSLLAFAYHPEYSLISTKTGSKKFITSTSQNAAVKESLSSDRLRAEIARTLYDYFLFNTE